MQTEFTQASRRSRSGGMAASKPCRANAEVSSYRGNVRFASMVFISLAAISKDEREAAEDAEARPVLRSIHPDARAIAELVAVVADVRDVQPGLEVLLRPDFEGL